MNYCIELLFQTTRVGAVELIQRLPPAHDTLALDEAGGLVGTLAGLGPAGLAFAGALVLDVDDGQPQQLASGLARTDGAIDTLERNL